MTRPTLDSTSRTQTQQNSVRIAEFCQLAFPSGTIYFTTADRDITWGGNTYTAQPLMAEYAGLQDASDLKARKAALKLSGIDSNLIGKITTDAYQYAQVQVWLGFFDANWQLLTTPYSLSDTLLMSNAVLSWDAQTGVIELSAETWDLVGTRDAAVLVTPETQRKRYIGDSGMDKAASIATQNIEWGGQSWPGGGPGAPIGGGRSGHQIQLV